MLAVAGFGLAVGANAGAERGEQMRNVLGAKPGMLLEVCWMNSFGRIEARPERSAALAAMALLALWTAAPAAHAQAAPDAPGQAQHSLGASVVLISDSNVSQTDAALAAQRHIIQQDETVAPSATIDELLPIGRQSVFLRGTAGYRSYIRNRVLNAQDVNLSAGVDKFIGQCRATLSGAFASAQSSQQDLVNLNNVILVKNVLTTTGGTFDAGCVRQIGFSPAITISDSLSKNSNAQRADINYRAPSARAALVYQNPIFGQMQIFAQYRKTEYFNRIIFVNGAPEHDGYDLDVGGLNFTRTIGSRLQTTLEVSYSDLKPFQPGATGFSGLTYAAHFTATPTGRISAKLNLERATNPTIRNNASFSRDDTLQGELDYALGARVKVSAGGGRANHAYVGGNPSPLFDLSSERDDSYFGQVQVDIGQKLSLLLNATHQIRMANLESLNYASNRIMLTLQGHF